MEAARYRLRFLSGVTTSSATYGSGTYGSQTYGQQAADPLAALRYRLIPLPAGYLSEPAWLYRQGAVKPLFEALLLSDEGPLDLVAVADGWLVLTPNDDRSLDETLVFPVELGTGADAGRVSHAWEPGDLDAAGVYRASIVLDFLSGRRLTIPSTDRHTFVVNASHMAGVL